MVQRGHETVLGLEGDVVRSRTLLDLLVKIEAALRAAVSKAPSVGSPSMPQPPSFSFRTVSLQKAAARSASAKSGTSSAGMSLPFSLKPP